MIKRVISLLLIISILSSISVVFAEQNNGFIESNEFVETKYFTQDNIIYNALKNNEEVSLFSGTSSDKITADFDIVLGFDMSVDMYDFDYNGEMKWIEAFKALSVQTSNNTRFAVVNDDSGTFTDDLESMINENVSNPYSGECDIVTLLDSCLNAFDETSIDRNKIVIVTASNVDNTEALNNKIEELQNYGIVPFVFVLKTEIDELLNDINCVYQCRNVLDLRLNISDVYLSLAEFNSVATMFLQEDSDTAQSNEYKSDLKSRYLLAQSLNNGSALATILNMYNCLPLHASYGGMEYDLTKVTTTEGTEATINVDIIVDFLKGNVDNLDNPTEKDNLFEMWEDIYNNKCSSFEDIEQYKSIIEKNLKRRFPVIVQIDGETHFISSYNSDSGKVQIHNQNDEITVEDISEIFDTYEYLSEIAFSSNLVKTRVVQNGTDLQIKKSYATTYPVDDNVSVVPSEFDGTTPKAGNTLEISVDLTEHANKTMVVVSKTEFENYVPKIHDTMPYYILRLYNDVLSNDVWYYTYLLKATNLNIVNGDDNGNFNDDDKVTRCQFVKMALEAAQIDVEPFEDVGHWATNYMNKAEELNILFWPNANLDEAICRYEAAYILKKLFIDNSQYIEIPTLLYEYDENVSNMQKTNWEKVKCEFDDTGALQGDRQSDAKQAFYQMYMNNVFVGDEDGNINPYNYLTKAQATKIIIKPLFELDENLTQVLVNFEQETLDEITPIYLNDYEYTLNDIVFDGKGVRKFSLTIPRENTYRYLIETIGNVISGDTVTLEVESASGEVGDYDLENKKYIKGEGTYIITVSKTGISNVGLHIQGINAPQEIVFDHMGVDANNVPHYYIFDDHPEFIRRCDILDDDGKDINGIDTGMVFEPSALQHINNMESGIYDLCAYHHVARDSIESKYTKGVPISENKDVYYDVVFYPTEDYSGNNSSKVYINKLGRNTRSKVNWDGLLDVLEQYNTDIFIEKEITEPTFLSQILEEKFLIKPASLDDIGYISMMLQFRVEGKLNFATVAYYDINVAKDVFDNNMYNIVSSYETLETVKGIGEASQTVISSPMSYIIDGHCMNTRLNFIINNQLFENRTQNIFTTNTSPIITNNRWTTPISAEIPIQYIGKGIKRFEQRDEDGNLPGEIQSMVENRIWKFDTWHSRIAEQIPMPDVFSEVTEKNKLTENEEFEKSFIESLIGRDDTFFIPFSNGYVHNGKDYANIVYGSNEFGITYKYQLKVRNIDTEPQKVGYLLECSKYNVSWNINIIESNGNIVKSINGETDQGRTSDNVATRLIFNEEIPGDCTAEIEVFFTMAVGAVPGVHNAFVINSYDEVGEVNYSLMDRNYIEQYPQS